MWKPIDDQAMSGDVVLVRQSPDGPTYAAYYGLATKAVSAGATKRYPWVFLDPTNGVNHMNSVAEYCALPKARGREPSLHDGHLVAAMVDDAYGAR